MAGMPKKSLIAIAAVFVLSSSASTVLANMQSHWDGTSAGKEWAPAQHFLQRSVVEYTLNRSLEEAFVSIVGESQGQTVLNRIEGSIWQTFQSMPKNSQGRLAPRAVRYIIHTYFAKEHGWLIHGLEANGRELDVAEVHKVQILQDRAPALVEALLGERKHAQGLGLSEVIAMVATLEQLIFDESIRLLELAYSLNDKSTSDRLNMDALHEVLMSYLMIFESGVQDGLTGEVHKVLKEAVHRVNPKAWQDLKVFADDAIRNFNWERRDRVNPFVEYHHSVEHVIAIVGGMVAGYGKWQNADCRAMKEELMSLDTVGYGTVLLKAFHSQPEGASHSFEESVEYLRSIGALDESLSNSPRVRIANYLTGPSNCIAQQTHYAVCCLSECEGLMSELESHIKAPTASAEQLHRVVGTLSSSSVDAPRDLSEQLVEKLHKVASQNKGEVPLHGRLFAQWMHYAFPNECPFPQTAANSAVLTTNHWSDRRHAASDEEKQQYIESIDCAEHNAAGCLPATQLSAWSDDEVLPFVEQTGRPLVNTARLAALAAVVLAVLRVAFATWQSAGRHMSVQKSENFQTTSLFV